MNEDREPDAKRSKQSLHDASTCRIDDLTKLRQLFVQNRDGKAVLFVDQGNNMVLCFTTTLFDSILR